MKITFAAMALTVVTILAVLGGFGAHRGPSVPILSAAAVPRASAPLTLVDNPQEEARMRQRAARRSDEVTRLLALPSGPVFALGDGADAATALIGPPAIGPAGRPEAADTLIMPSASPAAPPMEAESRVAALAEGPRQAAPIPSPAMPVAPTPSDGLLTPIAPEAYSRALRAAKAKPGPQVAAVPAASAVDTDANSTPPPAQAEQTDTKVAGLIPAPPLRAAVIPPLPRPRPATLTARAEVRQSAKTDQAKAEKAKAEKAKRAKRAAANRKRLLARRARAATAAKPAPVQTNWLGQPVATDSRSAIK